jgi:Mlc titration factor MtfA (ptsG expression regulator)
MLPPGDQRELRGLVQCFIAEKRIDGCRGLAVTDAMRVTVAAQACLLLLRREHDLFPQMETVLLYPSAYVARHTDIDEIGIHEEREEVMLGESWERGNVVLSWEDVQLDAQNPDDGFNVVLHEFAHQLDAENGSMDGAPLLPKSMRTEWARVMKAEFEALRKFADNMPEEVDDDSDLDPAFDERRERHEGDWVLDPYGAEDPSEFFAVATEAFFEDAPGLKQHHPAVHGMLAQYFAQDPAHWPGWR